MPGYDDWDGPFQDVFDRVPGADLLEGYEQYPIEDLFYAGWVDRDNTSDERIAARAEFLDMLGLPEELFPWDDWIEAMGYEDN